MAIKTRMEELRTWAQELIPERRYLPSDLIAGLTFAVVNVPQAMGHAVLATVNPVLGIFALMVASPVGAIFTGSAFMNVSTTAALSVAAGVALSDIPAGERPEVLTALVLMVGLIQFLMGLFRLGSLTRFISNAVMTGFLNGVAVLIILGQLSDLTGYQSAFSNRVVQALDLLWRVGQINVQVTAIGGLALVMIVLLLLTPLRRFAFIIAIALATAFLALVSLPNLPTASYFAIVPTVGDIATIPRALPQLTVPLLSLLPTLLLPAFSVAIIGLIQGAGVSQSTPNADGTYPDVSRDFLGQGVANIATSLVGGIPAGGSISGTALIKGAGAKSRWANIFVGLFVAVVVLLASPLVERVPMPALAALLIVAGVQGLRLPQALTIWHTGKVPMVVMSVTFVATLVIPLQFAVLLGMVLSIVFYAIQESNKIFVVEWVLQPEGLPLERPAPKLLPSHQFTLLHIYGSLFFAATKNLEDVLPDVDGTTHAVVAIILRGNDEIGSTFLTVLEHYAKVLQDHGSKLLLVGVDPAVLDQLTKTRVLTVIGEENVFLATPQLGAGLNQAVAAANAWLGQPPPGSGLKPL